MNRVYWPDDVEQWFDFDPVWTVADVRAYWSITDTATMLTLIRGKIGPCRLCTVGAPLTHGYMLTESAALELHPDLLAFIGEYVAQFVTGLELPEVTHGAA